MVLKVLYYIILYGFVLSGMFSGCSSIHNSVSDNTFNSSIIYPTAILDLPGNNFEFYLPHIALNELEAPISPVFDITEDFCTHDINHVSVSDPKLFTNDKTMFIDLARIQKDNYSFPLPGAKVISPYAGRRKNHAGTDLKTFANDTIRAAFDGIVRMAKAYYAYGNIIVLRHYNGLETIYSHNSKHLVKQGTYVKAGTPIALVGRTGRATTDHLHFEVRINGQHFNPELLFDMHTQELQSKCLVCTQGKNRVTISSIDSFSNLSFILNASN